ncbi:MAG: hypothetical protein CMG55_05285 [Candidatus Marinimicrobia bacterium]|nr:hypothetical protein [Candidatus Neomarinimicrobiota bacterium]|tara:strand:+ start:2613 stop:3485 length:873 start_codon:yes stop_codon:yes gene_type:complete
MIRKDMSSFLKILIIFLSLFFSNCFLFKNKIDNISLNEWSGKEIYIADLDESYKKTKRFNKIFSKIHSRRFKPYYRFTEKKFIIVGSFRTQKNIYLVFKDSKNKQYKVSLTNTINSQISIPSFIVFNETFLSAKKLIGRMVWLNDILDKNGFHANINSDFFRFQKVNVIDIVKFQNADNGHPIWLKVSNENGETALVRYNIQGVRFGIKDNYFLMDPLPTKWPNTVIDKIKNNQTEIGMTERQVRIAKGYPDEINFTSSRHGISEQWIYNVSNKKIYYQFEYGKLTYITY